MNIKLKDMRISKGVISIFQPDPERDFYDINRGIWHSYGCGYKNEKASYFARTRIWKWQ